MAKKVSVTSVTPASKVKATSKAQQARTRGLVMGIATATPAGRVAKTAATAVKSATKVSSAARANTRALKAANKDVGIKYKKGYNESNYSGRNESKPKQVAKSKVRSTSNIKAPMTSPSSYKSAKSGYNTWAKNNPELAKANPPSGKYGPKISRSEKENKNFIKNTKPMENVPKDVSDRFRATVKRLAAEEAKKKK